MILQKELSIKGILDEMQVLKGRLIQLSNKYNRLLINVSAINYKDIVVGGGKRSDIMLNKVIHKEAVDDEFDVVLASFNSYKAEVINKMREMIQTKPTSECIVFFRDELRWKWGDIAKLFNYSDRQCRNLYNKSKRR